MVYTLFSPFSSWVGFFGWVNIQRSFAYMLTAQILQCWLYKFVVHLFLKYHVQFRKNTVELEKVYGGDKNPLKWLKG